MDMDHAESKLHIHMVIGASTSEPHRYASNLKSVTRYVYIYIYIYMYIYIYIYLFIYLYIYI